MRSRFDDRRHAGRVLAGALASWSGQADVVVLGLPRGGVPVGYEVALGLGAPLDVLVVRKLGLPGHEELAVGAIASGGAIVVNREVVDWFDVPEHAIREAAEREQVELHRREAAYRDGRPMRPLAGRTVIVVDDGLATGSTMRAAVIAVRALGPARLIVGVPVGATSTCEEMADVADHVVCTTTPRDLHAVGQSYADFTQTSDEEVRELLAAASQTIGSRPIIEARQVTVAAGDIELVGDLAMPDEARGLVLFAHGSGSSRHSPRNRFVADVLQRAGLATFLIDLLTLGEERADARTGELRFDVDLLALRLVAVTDWLASEPATGCLPLGLFGASTGAAAALIAAAERPSLVAAVVSRGGRPDLASDVLADVHAPTLLLVGERDEVVIDLNRRALTRLAGERHLEIVPGAGHLFEEPGTLDIVADRASRWLRSHLRAQGTTVSR